MNLSQLQKSVVIVLFLGAVCISLLTPIRDNDFFWHLATGKWIAEHQEFPKADPFAYTASPADKDSYRARILLSQYWLANLLQYGVFSAAGLYGIIGLRVLIEIMTLLLLMAHMRRRGVNALPAVFLLIPVCFILGLYRGDRPNQMTFFFVALFLYLAESLKRGEKRGYLLPLVLLVWANIHGGFLLGSAVACIMGVAEILRKTFLRSHCLDKRRIAALLATVGAGFLSPNGYTVLYSVIFETSKSYFSTISENATPWTYARMGDLMPMIMIGIALLVAAWYFSSRIISGDSGRKETLLAVSDELMTVVFLAIMTFTAIRYIPILVLVLVPMSAPVFSGKIQKAVGYLSKYRVPELAIAAFSVWWIYTSYETTVLKLPPVDKFFPDDAVRFIKENGLKGRFLNAYDWGGYLIWQFYPERVVFTDGRGLNMDIYGDYVAVMNGDQSAAAGGEPRYRTVLDSFSVRHLVIPPNDMVGNMYPILNLLVKDPQWRLLFVGRNSLIFSRDQGGPSYNKTLCYNLALADAIEFISLNPDIPFAYITAARANYFLGRPMSAMKFLEEALQRRPALRGGPVERELNALRGSRQTPFGVR